MKQWQERGLWSSDSFQSNECYSTSTSAEDAACLQEGDLLVDSTMFPKFVLSFPIPSRFMAYFRRYHVPSTNTDWFRRRNCGTG